MVCYNPMQASYSLNKDGKKILRFQSSLVNQVARNFANGFDTVSCSSNVLVLPCGSCMGCRLEKSRQWAVRCLHEASLHTCNCFLTLTYNDEFLPKDGSLHKDHFQNFMKRLRNEVVYDNPMIDCPTVVRYFQCGEYGENFGRPHYHACIFGLEFIDADLWKTVNGQKLYVSQTLNNIWGQGFCVIGSLTFESAAYVARYCTKKVTGKGSTDHYQGRLPEYATMSLKPGIGSGWYDKWKSDCFPSDYLIVNGVKCKPPRFYDLKLEKEDPELFAKIKQSRLENAIDDDDNSYRRLKDREKCQEARFKKLIRTIERSSDL